MAPGCGVTITPRCRLITLILPFFYKDIFYKNIEAEIYEILRIF